MSCSTTPMLDKTSSHKKVAVDTPTDAANKEALRQILAFTALGGSLGALGRGLLGVPNLFRTHRFPSINPNGSVLASLDPNDVNTKRPGAWIDTPGPQFRMRGSMPLQLPRIYPEEERGRKTAGVPAAPVPPAAPQIPKPTPLKYVADKFYDHIAKPLGLNRLMDTPLGNTTRPETKFWHGPGIFTGAALGTAGGWQLMKWLQDKQQENEDDTELQSAEKEYMQSLKGLQHLNKLSAVREKFEKHAGGGSVITPNISPNPPVTYGHFWGGSGRQQVQNVGGLGANAWATLATLVGLPTAYIVHKYVSSGTGNKALQEAMFQRQRLLQRQQPAAIQFKPPPSASDDQSDDTDMQAV